MLTPKEAKKLLLDNFTDEDGDLDISNIDLSDFEGDVYLSGWKVKRDLFQGFQDVGGDLCQYSQKVGGCLYQDSDECCEPKYKMTLQEFWNSKKLLAIHCKTKEQINTFYSASDRLGKTWNVGARFTQTRIEFDKEDYNVYFDNQGRWLSAKMIKDAKISFSPKQKLLEFDDIDFRPTSNYVVDPYPASANKSTLYKSDLQKELDRANRIIDALLLLVREKRGEE